VRYLDCKIIIISSHFHGDMTVGGNKCISNLSSRRMILLMSYVWRLQSKFVHGMVSTVPFHGKEIGLRDLDEVSSLTVD
jgi:hypothetical protein